MNRRSFLKASLGTTAISLCSAPALVKAAGKKYDKHIPIGLELYSLRDVINHETFPKYLKWVAETGFEVVEFAGYHGYSAKELRTMLDDYGIKASSTHIGFDQIKGKFVVNRDGSIVDVEVVRSPDPNLSKEAERVVKLMPKWKPARQGNKTVRARFNLPVNFRLN